MNVFEKLSGTEDFLTEAEMQRAMGMMGRYPSKREVRMMIAQCDANGDGTN